MALKFSWFRHIEWKVREWWRKCVNGIHLGRDQKENAVNDLKVVTG